MSCSICGKGTGPGAMLCRPCKAALKRARQFTVQALPGTPIAGTGPGGSFPVMTEPRPARSVPAAERDRRLALAALAVALFAAAAFVGGRGLAAAQAGQQAPALVTIAPLAPLPPPQFAATAPDVLPPVRRTTASRRVPGTAAVPAPPAAVDVQVPVSSPPAVAIAQAPDSTRSAAVAVPAPAPDRWQAVNSALARCADEGGLSGFICDQRVRLNACDGYWGRVPQCPTPSLPDNPR